MKNSSVRKGEYHYIGVTSEQENSFRTRNLHTIRDTPHVKKMLTLINNEANKGSPQIINKNYLKGTSCRSYRIIIAEKMSKRRHSNSLSAKG